MRIRWPVQISLAVLSALLAVVAVALSGVTAEATGALVLFAFVAVAIVYGVMYVVMRGRHW